MSKIRLWQEGSLGQLSRAIATWLELYVRNYRFIIIIIIIIIIIQPTLLWFTRTSKKFL